MIVWHWLVNHGLYEDLLSAVIFLGLGQLLVGQRLKRFWRWLLRLTDLLDTSTPGGLTDVNERLAQTEKHLASIDAEFQRQAREMRAARRR